MADKPITDAGVISQILEALPLTTTKQKGLQDSEIMRINGASVENANTAPVGVYRCNVTDHENRNLPYNWGILFTSNIVGVKFQLFATSINELYFRTMWDDWLPWRKVSFT